MHALAFLWSPAGRVGRSSYWMAFLGLVVASFVLLALPGALRWLALLLIWPQVTVHINRLHDIGRGASWVAVPFALNVVTALSAPLLGLLALVGAAQRGHLPGSFSLLVVLLLVTLLVDVAFVLWLGLSRSDPETNAFGPPALEGPPPPAGTLP